MEVNHKQPNLEVRVKNIIEVDGLKFKDLNNSGKLEPYKDWRLSPKERADNLVSLMNTDEKVGMMLINSRQMGLSQKDKSKTSHDGVLDEGIVEKGETIFALAKVYGTTHTIENMHLRHFILRDNWSPSEMAEWVNTMNEVCEGSRLGIPCLIASNSRNENTEFIFGMNDAAGIFSTWPGTLGLAAAAKGDMKNGGDASLISQFAQIAHDEWDAVGLRKGYMYMADTVTDPRWQRIYGTFGEDPEFISDVIGRIIDGFQGKTLGNHSIAMTTKHFPGGGPRENGFDPHYEEGKWNLYPTPGSLEKYHLPPFRAAVEHGTSSMMPYYSIPSIKKSVVQEFEGEDIPFEEVGFTFNHYFLNTILREKLGFKGYINSDSGVTSKMSWGVETLSEAERFAKAINAGTDLISDTNDIENLKKAIEKGWISEKRINEANVRLLTEMFALGLFDDRTYVSPDHAAEVVENPANWEAAYEAHKKSVTVLKNQKQTLPLTAEKLEGKKVYVEVFQKETERATSYTEKARQECQELGQFTLTDNYEEADVAILFLSPKSGAYFNATPGLLELEICEDKTVAALDGTSYQETTLSGMNHLKEVADSIHIRGGKVIMSVNVILPWILGNVEPLADALIAGYDTYYKAQYEVMAGNSSPVGVLPLTLPASEAVIAVDENGECVSRNDVPGYVKDEYMPEGFNYAYKDSDGNIYKLGHGLTF
ncbi:glycoside hydrolase family 3 protein [Bacillus sp. ISL-40]|uniref:glycoside hydrolase family 3 protein n=1 Tax=unclassified Bacillus (in: firmicutes) TaxID=185979 RepID=UPI001BE5EB37|nr:MULTISPECIES: glycoside hydrolase family 3 N-terminal domain-containing protein [unclassified Bacillus (in: firmicutes)]MBT2698748.1 glycoside hydrolase family 3 protein [Bacillus sp. ISL-40]MBT2720806.1 glycoside hydrolase family 3 protein [Bacillus sp. ISL-46]MBT2740914.1 glycoside hydrolase family 3 protein [Bacillus sp. ISL-77]